VDFLEYTATRTNNIATAKVPKIILREVILVSSQWFRGLKKSRHKVSPLREICQLNQHDLGCAIRGLELAAADGQRPQESGATDFKD
jgi:hypothetical protein